MTDDEIGDRLYRVYHAEPDCTDDALVRVARYAIEHMAEFGWQPEPAPPSRNEFADLSRRVENNATMTVQLFQYMMAVMGQSAEDGYWDA